MASVKDTLKQRQKTHGSFTDHAACAQALKAEMKKGKNWDSLTPVQKEALEMIQHKVARVLSGNPNAKDHYHDIAGYATLAEAEASD